MAMLDFNVSYYLSQNPDVAFAISRGVIASAQEHFNTYGRFEGRNPNAYFDVTYYLTANADVAAARVNPLEHFLTFGAQEGRFANATADAAIDTDGNNLANEFDSAAYLAANEDVAANVGPGKAFATAYEHYVLFGQFETRAGVPANGPFTNTGTSPSTGQTQTLTTGIDNLNGTNGNDTFVGTIADGNTSTLQSGDVINGGAGIDTLRIVASNASPSIIVPQLSSVENIEFQGFNSDLATLNLATSTGVQSVTLNNGTGSLDVINQSSIINVGASNTTGGTLTVGYTAAAVAGTADIQNVSVLNTVDTNIVVNGVETMNLTAAGTNTGAQIGGDAVRTVNVAGAGSLVLTNDFAATTTTFNASSNTGGVTAGFTAGGNVAVTGGSGNDVFRFFGGLTTQDTVNGGTGFDTVRVELGVNGSDLSAAPAAAAFNGLTNIDRVAFDGANGVTVNGSTFTNTGITNIEFNTVGDDLINNAGSARTYEFGAANEGNAQFNMNGTSTTLNIDLLGTVQTAPVNGASNTVEVDVLAVNLAGTQPSGTVATINLSSLGNFQSGTFNTVEQIDAVRGSTVNVDGSAALHINGSANNIILNAAQMTGDLTVRGSIFVGETGTAAEAAGPNGTPAAVTGVNTAATNGQTGVDLITLGAGRDIVQFGSNGLDSGIIQIFTPTGGTEATDAARSGTILHDTIVGFTAGASGDVLDIVQSAANGPAIDAMYTGLAAASQAAINALAGANATLLAAADIAASGNADAGWTAFSFQGQTYALYEGDTNANGSTAFSSTDTLVQLAGVNIADLTTANFA